jgi:hypothetical protein
MRKHIRLPYSEVLPTVEVVIVYHAGERKSMDIRSAKFSLA